MGVSVSELCMFVSGVPCCTDVLTHVTMNQIHERSEQRRIDGVTLKALDTYWSAGCAVHGGTHYVLAKHKEMPATPEEIEAHRQWMQGPQPTNDTSWSEWAWSWVSAPFTAAPA